MKWSTLPPESYVTGRVYRVHSRRSLGIAVWNGIDGFVGLCHEWGSHTVDQRVLTTELHPAFNEDFGTAQAHTETALVVPDGVAPVEFIKDHDGNMQYNAALETFLRRAEAELAA